MILNQNLSATVSHQEIGTKNQGYLAKEVLTFKEASALLGVSSSMLYKLTHKRAITFYKPNGKLIYFKRADLLNWMLSKKEESVEQANTNFITKLIKRRNERRNEKTNDEKSSLSNQRN